MRALLSSGRLAGYLSGLILLAGAAGSIATAQPRPASQAPAAAEAPPAATLSAIIDRYIAWRGGAAFEGLRSFQESGSLDANGNRQTVKIWCERDGHERTEVSVGDLTQTEVTTPSGAWRVAGDGQVDELRGGALARRNALVEFGDALESRGGATAKLAGTEEFENKTWSVVQIDFKNGDPHEALIDPTTGALCCYRTQRNGAKFLLELDDWRVVDGVRMPFRQTSHAEAVTVEQFTDVQVNGLLPDSLFQRPVQPHRTSFAGGAAWSGWIDFEFYDDAVIFLPVTVNGHATTAMLDSGASLSVVDHGQAAALGLATRGDISVAGAGGLASSALAKGVGFGMGDARIDGLTVLTPDFTATANSIQHEIPAVLGEEVFGELIVDVDFARRRLAFRDPKAFVKPANAIELPLVARGQLRIVPASIDGRPPEWFQFDLGDGGSLDIFPAYAAAQDLPGNHRLSQSLLYGFGGAATVSVGSLGAVEFAGMKFANVPATFPSANPTTNDPGEAGRIGIEVLDRFRLLIDYPDNRLYLVPTPGAERRPFYRNRLGLAMLPEDGALVVKLVAPNSPAAAAGFHAGDRVTRLDGEPTASMTRAREREVFGAPAGTKVDIMLGGGERRIVTLADFY